MSSIDIYYNIIHVVSITRSVLRAKMIAKLRTGSRRVMMNVS